MKNKKMLGNILLLITAIIWGTAFVAQRVGMESIEPATFTSSRMWLSALTAGTASLILGQNKAETVRKPEEKRQTLIGGICCGLFLAGASLFQQFGIVYTTAGKAGFITALYILLVPAVNFLLFKKRAGLHAVTEDFRITHGDTLVCICALLFTGHILCCDHFSRLGDPVKIAAIQFVVVALVSGILALIAETPSWAEIKTAAVPILWCGVMSGGVGYTLQMVAQGFTDPTVASLLMSLESVFAALTGALLLGERMTSRELLGCVIMFAAIILVQLPAPRATSRNTSAASSGKFVP